jgi:hypothetical protein
MNNICFVTFSYFFFFFVSIFCMFLCVFVQCCELFQFFLYVEYWFYWGEIIKERVKIRKSPMFIQRVKVDQGNIIKKMKITPL